MKDYDYDFSTKENGLTVMKVAGGCRRYYCYSLVSTVAALQNRLPTPYAEILKGFAVHAYSKACSCISTTWSVYCIEIPVPETVVKKADKV
jgi:hypothetical protein